MVVSVSPFPAETGQRRTAAPARGVPHLPAGPGPVRHHHRREPRPPCSPRRAAPAGSPQTRTHRELQNLPVPGGWRVGVPPPPTHARVGGGAWRVRACVRRPDAGAAVTLEGFPDVEMPTMVEAGFGADLTAEVTLRR
jgi:hypothetical protein